MICRCGGGNQPDKTRYCGRHFLIVTIHADGWMAGCHCGIGYKMPKGSHGLYGTNAEAVAARIHVAHAGGIYPATGTA